MAFPEEKYQDDTCNEPTDVPPPCHSSAIIRDSKREGTRKQLVIGTTTPRKRRLKSL